MDHSPKDEYDELMELIRYYGNIRFATLTLFAAVVAGLLAILYASSTTPPPKTIKILLEVGGLIATAAFWIMELSAVFVWIHCARRASRLEADYLQFRILSTMRGAPRFYFLPTTYAVSGLYLASLLFWIYTLTQA